MEGLLKIGISEKGFVGSDSQNNSFGAGRRFVCTGSDFLRFGSVFGSHFPSEVAKSAGRVAKY